MKLAAPLIRLPLRFDAEALCKEIDQFGDDDWVLHPTGFEGSSAVVLISARGGLNDDFAISAPMQATPHLARCPHIRAVLASLEMPIGRTRLMRLHAGQAVPEHVDDNYHWWRRTRIHIPIRTDPQVMFHCGGESAHMGPGQCWTFDNQRPHRVDNNSSIDRVHLVADTLSSPKLQRLVEEALDRDPGERWPPLDESASIPLEPYRFGVLQSHELESLVAEIWQGSLELCATSSARAALRAHLDWMLSAWAETLSHHGHRREAELEYAAIIRTFVDDLPPAFGRSFAPGSAARRAISIIGTVLQVTNRSAPPRTVAQLRTESSTPRPPGLPEGSTAVLTIEGHQQLAHASAGCPSSASDGTMSAELLARFVDSRVLSDPLIRSQAESLHRAGLIERRWGRLPSFDRPVFIVAAPRSGSSMLFELMARNPAFHSLGRESDDILDRCIGHRPHRTDDLCATDANPQLELRLRTEFIRHLIDHRGQPLHGIEDAMVPDTLRLLEKTPRNTLRIPFLRALWPDARFIYLYRDPAQSISSIMEAWRSGGFVTQRNLVGWRARRWSLLLPPGWEQLEHQPLASVAAFQWKSANTAILSALDEIDASYWTTIDYGALVADPTAAFERLSHFAGAPVPISTKAPRPRPLPLSHHTVSAPSPDKWRWEREAIEPRLLELASIQERFEALSRSRLA